MSLFFAREFFPFTVIGTLLVGLLFFVFYYASKRKRLCSKLPGMKIRYFSLLGDVNNLQSNIPEKFEKSKNIYMLQTLRGYTQLLRNELFFTFWFSFIPFVFVVKAQGVEQLIAGTKNLQKSWTYNWLHPWLNTGLITSFGPKWKSRRKLISPSFHFDILRDFLPVVNAQAQILVDNLRKETSKEWTDIPEPVSLCALDIICETTMGVSVNAQRNSDSEFVKATVRATQIMTLRWLLNPVYYIDWIFFMSPMGREFKEKLKVLHDFTRSVIRQKKSELSKGVINQSMPRKRKALMDLLLEHHVQNQTLTEEDIREEVDTFTFAGHDTTSMGMSWALYLIGLYKDVQNRLHKELDDIFGDDTERPVTEDDIKEMLYLDRVLKESQRLYPSVPIIGRRSTADTVLNGCKIPEGVSCVINIYELHRDPDVFPDPEKFDPDRFLPENSAGRHPYAYIPFSAGSRNCVGQKFAVQEEKVVIASILRNFTIESLEQRDKVLPTPEAVLRNSEPLKIRIRNR